MSDLLYSLGLDSNEFENNLESSSAKAKKFQGEIGEIANKSAKASAESLKTTLTAEEELAEFRKKTAFERLGDEEKLASLRSEATAMLEQIGTMEGRSAEKAQLQLQFEKTKSEIYGLNQKLVADTTAATIEQTAEVSKQPGLLGKIGQAATSVKETFKEMGVTLKGVGLGILVAQFFNLGKEAVAAAQKTRDEFDAVGKTLDRSTRSLATLGDTFGAVKGAAVSTVGFLLGGFTQLGEVIGSTINRVRGISEAEENIAESIVRSTKAVEARAAALRAEQTDVENVARARKAAADAERKAAFERLSDLEKHKQLFEELWRLMELQKVSQKDTVGYEERRLLIQEKKNQLTALETEIIKTAAEESEKAAKALEKIHRENLDYLQRYIAAEKELKQIAFEKLDPVRQYAELTKEELRLKKLIKAEGTDEVVVMEAKIELEKLQTQMIEVKKNVISDVVVEEKKVTKELATQLDLTNARLSGEKMIIEVTQKTGKANEDLTDRELDQKIVDYQRQLSAARRARQGAGSPDTGEFFLQDNLEQLRAERQLRSRFRRSYSVYGEEALEQGQFGAFDDDRLLNYVRPEDERRAAIDSRNLQEIVDRLSGRRPFGGSG